MVVQHSNLELLIEHFYTRSKYQRMTKTNSMNIFQYGRLELTEGKFVETVKITRKLCSYATGGW